MWHPGKGAAVSQASQMSTASSGSCSTFSSLPICLRKQQKTAHVLQPLHPCGRSRLSSRLLGHQPEPALAITAMCGVNQRMENISLCLSVSLPFKYKRNLRQGEREKKHNEALCLPLPNPSLHEAITPILWEQTLKHLTC